MLIESIKTTLDLQDAIMNCRSVIYFLGYAGANLITKEEPLPDSVGDGFALVARSVDQTLEKVEDFIAKSLSCKGK